MRNIEFITEGLLVVASVYCGISAVLAYNRSRFLQSKKKHVKESCILPPDPDTINRYIKDQIEKYEGPKYLSSYVMVQGYIKKGSTDILPIIEGQKEPREVLKKTYDISVFDERELKRINVDNFMLVDPYKPNN